MKYYITTKNGAVKSDNGNIITFNASNDAWHWAVNHLDISDCERVTLELYSDELEDTKVKLFKQIDAKYSCAAKKLDALMSAGLELEEILEIALQVG
ncbi:MAG: hypothetical protein ACH349_01595 [Candidatus Rhabdochlamydia sp.]